MGKRRIRLIQQYDSDLELIGVDTSEQRRLEAEQRYGIRTADNLEDILAAENIKCAFISTSPLSHASLIEKCLVHYVNVFTEINVVADGYDKNIELAKQNGLVLFLSSTLLYREEIRFMRRALQRKGRVNYCYHVGQYLPDWHPWESFKNFFVNDKRTNGCRELFAIELPWISNLFGEITEITAVKDKMSCLDIDYADNYQLLIQHKNGSRGMMALDVVARRAMRALEIYGEQIHLFWDGTPQGLAIYDTERGELSNVALYDKIDKLNNYSNTIIENAYYEEIVNFFELLEHKGTPEHSFEKDRKILEWIDKIEQE